MEMTLQRLGEVNIIPPPGPSKFVSPQTVMYHLDGEPSSGSVKPAEYFITAHDWQPGAPPPAATHCPLHGACAPCSLQAEAPTGSTEAVLERLPERMASWCASVRECLPLLQEGSGAGTW